MDIQLFDNYEEDGQLSMFDLGEDLEEIQSRPEPMVQQEQVELREGRERASHTNIRIQKCSSCGKLLLVKEAEGGYTAFCNACGISYFQKL